MAGVHQFVDNKSILWYTITVALLACSMVFLSLSVGPNWLLGTLLISTIGDSISLARMKSPANQMVSHVFQATTFLTIGLLIAPGIWQLIIFGITSYHVIQFTRYQKGLKQNLPKGWQTSVLESIY